MKALGLFDFVNALTGADAVNGVKNNLLQTVDPEVTKSFDSLLFMVRRGLAQNMDVIVCAEQMNLMHRIDPWMQWCYAFHTITPRKRYDKWSKKSPENPDLIMLCDFYQISPEKASEYLQLFTDEQMEYLRKAVERQSNDKPKKAK